MGDRQADPAVAANRGRLTSHEIAVGETCVTNAKAGQCDLLITVPVTGGPPRSNCRSQLTQFIAVRNTLTPSGLPSGADGILKGAIVVPKRESEVNVPRLARCPFGRRVSPFVSRMTHMCGNPAERDRFVERVEVTEESLDFQDQGVTRVKTPECLQGTTGVRVDDE